LEKLKGGANMEEPHGYWKTKIDERNADLDTNWWPFVENINDILARMQELEQEIDNVSNTVNEARGLGRGLYKLLYKLGFLDKEWKINWVAAQNLKEVLENDRNEGKDDGKD